MTKITKNVVMVFTLVCVVVLIVFCIELFMLNRENGDVQNATISNNEPEPPANGDDPQIDDDPFQNEAPEITAPAEDSPEETNQENEVIRPAANTLRHIFPLSEGIANLILHVDVSLFESENLGESWLFSYIDGEDAWLEIGFAFVPPQDGTRELAQTFLHNYLEGDYSTFEGERTVGNSAVRGLFVTGENEGETFEAWLRDLADLGADSLALLVVVRHSTEEERAILYSILDTMYIEMLNVEEEEDPENGE